jgi:hypothetical protein
LALRLVFHRPLCQTEGALLGVDLATPDHTTFSPARRWTADFATACRAGRTLASAGRQHPGEARVEETQRRQAIPMQLELAEFEQFVLWHLCIGSHGPAPKLSLHKIINYVLKILYLGCQWKEHLFDYAQAQWEPEIQPAT